MMKEADGRMDTERVENSKSESLRVALNDLYDRQQQVQKAFSEFEAQDLSRENATLRAQLATCLEQLKVLNGQLAKMSRDNEILEKNLRGELSQKRISLLKMHEAKFERYLAAGFEREMQQIGELQAKFDVAYKRHEKDLRDCSSLEQSELMRELDNLSMRITAQATAAQNRAKRAWHEMYDMKTESMKEIAQQQLKGETLRTARKFFNWENFLGLKLISAIGIFLVLIGVFAGAQHVYRYMDNGTKCAFIFVLGLIMILVGEILHRKWSGFFSKALTAGGVGVLFLGAALGYFILDIFPMYGALILCAGVSALSFRLSYRYQSQMISTFALVGGYLPLFALGNSYGQAINVWACIYFTILNLFALSLATRRSWHVTRFIGLFFGLGADTFMIVRVWHNDNSMYLIVAFAVLISFFSYLLIPVFGALATKTRINRSDIVLLAFNLFFRFFIGLLLFAAFDLTRYHAWVPFLFAASCFSMAVFVEREPRFDGSRPIRALFFITGVAYAALVIPLWLDLAWFSLGWLVEACGLLLWGIKTNRRRFTMAGGIIGGMCLLPFLLFNIPNWENRLFVWQYLSITLGLLAVTAMLAYKGMIKHIGVQSLNFCTILNFYAFIVYLLQNPVLAKIKTALDLGQDVQLMILSCIVFGMLYSYLLPRIKPLSCVATRAASMVVGLFASIWMVGFNGFSGNLLSGGSNAVGITALVFLLYLAGNVIGIFWMRDLLQFITVRKILPIKWYPLTLSGYFVLLLSQNLVVQLKLEASSLLLTTIFGLTALGWILYGFHKRNHITRFSGLGLLFLAVLKLFLLDLSMLSAGLRIVSYFSMGILLLCISFTYQYFNKKLAAQDSEEKVDDLP
ncbi:DUF2339 domain-containing protein [Lachnospiraceae bacterium ZAX-1]